MSGIVTPMLYTVIVVVIVVVVVLWVLPRL